MQRSWFGNIDYVLKSLAEEWTAIRAGRDDEMETICGFATMSASAEHQLPSMEPPADHCQLIEAIEEAQFKEISSRHKRAKFKNK